MSLYRSDFEQADVDIQAKDTIFRGFFEMLKLRLKYRKFAGGWGKEISRELFKRGNAAAAILYDPQNDLIGLIEQFRVGALSSEFGPWCLEVVAGMVEGDETPEELITREIFEEAGITEHRLIHITDYYSSPGGCDEKIYLFCALCDLSNAGGIFGLEEENEDIRLNIYQASDVFSGMLKSRANNAATLIGLQWLQLNRNHLKNDGSSQTA